MLNSIEKSLEDFEVTYIRPDNPSISNHYQPDISIDTSGDHASLNSHNSRDFSPQNPPKTMKEHNNMLTSSILYENSQNAEETKFSEEKHDDELQKCEKLILRDFQAKGDVQKLPNSLKLSLMNENMQNIIPKSRKTEISMEKKQEFRKDSQDSPNKYHEFIPGLSRNREVSFSLNSKQLRSKDHFYLLEHSRNEFPVESMQEKRSYEKNNKYLLNFINFAKLIIFYIEKKRGDSLSDPIPGRDLMEKSLQSKKFGECSSREKINDTQNEKPSFELIKKKKNRLETPVCFRAHKDTLNKGRSFLEETKSEILMTKDTIRSSKSMKKNKKQEDEEEEYKNTEEHRDSSDFYQQQYNAEIIKKDNLFEHEEKNGSSSQMMNIKKNSSSKLMMINDSFGNLQEEDESTDLRRFSNSESRIDGEINEINECDLSHIMCENGDIIPLYHQEKEHQGSNNEMDSFLELMTAEVSDIEGNDGDVEKEEIQAWLLSFD